MPGVAKRERGECGAAPEAVEAWIGQLTVRFEGRPIAVCVEQSRGLLFSLCKYENLVLYPIHPATAKDFRKAVYPSGSKDDPLDADVLLDFLLKHRDRLRVWQPDTPETRELQFLVEDRRRLVDQKTSSVQQLTQRLKLYFPQALAWFGSADSVLLWRVLEQWPDLEALRKVDCGKLKSFLERDRRCSVPEFEPFCTALQQSVPATRDAAVIRSSVLFVGALVQQLLHLRTVIQRYEKHIRELTETHPEVCDHGLISGRGRRPRATPDRRAGHAARPFCQRQRLTELQRDCAGQGGEWETLLGPYALGLSQVSAPDLSGMGTTFTRPFGLGTRLLRWPKGSR